MRRFRTPRHSANGELPALLELARVLGAAPNFRSSLDGALDVLRETYGAVGVAVTLADPADGRAPARGRRRPPGRPAPVGAR